MDSIREEFRTFYEAQLREHVRLPAHITSQYQVKACLSSKKNKAVYQLASFDASQSFVLRQLPLSDKQANETEYALLQTLDHPRIPKALELFEEGDSSYLIRTYVEGISLYNLVKSHGTLGERECLRLTIELCDILAFLHAQNPPVIHRDIKPQNIVCSPNGQISLIDFDASRTYDPAASQDTTYIGTCATAPPEQFGYAQTDVRSDIYAVGVLLIYLSTGLYDRAAISSMPPRLARIAQTCTQFAPRDRYASAARLRRALRFARHAVLRSAAKYALIAAGFTTSFVLGSLFPFGKPATMAFAPLPSPAAPLVSLSPSASFEQKENVVFASTQIERNVRIQLHKPNGEPLYREDLDQITELCIVGDSELASEQSFQFDDDQMLVDGNPVKRGEVESLADLALLPNLNKLILVQQRIRDLAPIQDLPLTTLNIDGNFVSDLSPVRSIPSLSSISANRNPIRDLSPLAELPRLKNLSLKQTSAFDISPLAKLQTLEFLDLFQIPCADYSPLTSLPLLRSLNMSDSSARDVALVANMPNLRELIAHRCGITSLDMFHNSPKLERLELWQNDIHSLKGIDALGALRSLNLNYTPVEDLSPLQLLPELEVLDLREVNADLTPLLRIPTLKVIRCTADMQPQINVIDKQAKFTIQIEK